MPARALLISILRNSKRDWNFIRNGVLIMEKCGDLLPDYFSFVGIS
ncbi:hypothetical protein ACI7YW_10260 [Clostridium ljungdahlii]